MSDEHLMLWAAGYLSDDQLTYEEVMWLEEAAFDAVAQKLATHSAPETLQ